MSEEPILLPVEYNQQVLEFPVRLLQFGYSYKLEVTVEGRTLLFEPDEERNWRAVLPQEELPGSKAISPALLQAIVNALDQVLK